MSDIHIIKLAVGIEDLEHFKNIQERETFDYHGQAAVPCWTRHMPKRGDEILKKEGSIYRVIKNRIMCRHRILGFEIIEGTPKGRMCMIVQDAQMIETIHMPRRSFQGWRYLKGTEAPDDKGFYTGRGEIDEMPQDLAKQLKEAGLF